jgi:CRP-like cAMP-binding protein
VTHDDLLRAARRLHAHPADHGAWLEVGAILTALDRGDEAEAVFATLGEAARVGGQVALAVACGRHLAARASLGAAELIDQVVETYATGGPHFTFESAPAQPPSAAPPLPAVESASKGELTALLAAAGAWLTKRAPATLPPAPLLSALTKPGARALVGVMTARAVPAGAVIIDAGEPPTALYWVAYGACVVSRDGVELGEVHSGAFFGEIALVGGTTRSARVTARGDVWLLEIPARAVEAAATKHPQLGQVLAFHARARLLHNLVQTSDLFRGLAPADRDELLRKFTTELVAAGKPVIREGVANDHLWVLVSGRCQVKIGGAAVADLGPGAAVGELSLLRGTAASADVTATEPCVLLRLSRADFELVTSRHAAVRAEIERMVAAREEANRGFPVYQDASDLIV